MSMTQKQVCEMAKMIAYLTKKNGGDVEKAKRYVRKYFKRLISGERK